MAYSCAHQYRVKVYQHINEEKCHLILKTKILQNMELLSILLMKVLRCQKCVKLVMLMLLL